VAEGLAIFCTNALFSGMRILGTRYQVGGTVVAASEFFQFCKELPLGWFRGNLIDSLHETCSLIARNFNWRFFGAIFGSKLSPRKKNCFFDSIAITYLSSSVSIKSNFHRLKSGSHTSLIIIFIFFIFIFII